MTTACMHTCSRPTVTRCGGTGDGTGALPDQVLGGDGILHGTIAAGTLHGILLIGTVVIGVAIGEATGAVIGVPDGIIITRIMDGEALIKGTLIPTTTAVQRVWNGEVRWVLRSIVTVEPEAV